MRLGCSGCLALLLVLAGSLGTVLGTGWIAVRSLQDPGILAPTTSPSDGARAQQKIFQLLRPGDRPRPSAEPVVLSEAEVNAFLTRHLAVEDAPFESAFVRLRGAGALEFAGRLPLGRVLGEPPLSAIGGILPERSMRRPIWLRARLVARQEPGTRRYLRLDVEEFWVGRQRLPAVAAKLILDPGSLGLLGLPLPERIEHVSIERGRLVIRTVF